MIDPTGETTTILPNEGSGTPEGAKDWLALINASRERFDVYHDLSDRVCELYGSLDRMGSAGGDREFQIFWANLEVLRPSIYARAPIPVVTPRFSDRKPLQRKAAQVLERALVTLTAETALHNTLKLVRDDLARISRGVAWALINEDGEVEFEHIQREDFLCDPDARSWQECRWVARRVYLDRKDVDRLFPNAEVDDLGFHKDGPKVLRSSFEVEVWEIWHKAEKAVVHVADGYKGILKRTKPPVDLKGFFPCPEPAMGTVEPGTLIPIPDMVYYRDQIDEVHALTRRIGAVSEMIRLKGFFDSSAGEARDAIETAFRTVSDSALLVPVAGLGNLVSGSSQLIEWFPVEQAANVVQTLIAIRRQLIEDIYQITGLSDIMRGSTNASETATAQNLKAQYGSVRVRERQEEMIRMARDLYRIAVEMLAEKVDGKVLLELAQIDDMQSDADVRKERKAADAQAKEALEQAEAMQAQGQEVPPEMVEQAEAMYRAELQRLDEIITTDKLTAFLKKQRARAFSLDVETDSTISANEDAEKQRRLEFMGALGNFLPSAMQAIQMMPESAPLMAQAMRFVASGFRAREMDQVIDDFTESVEQAAKQPRPDPNAGAQAAAEAEQQLEQAKMQMEQSKLQMEGQIKQAEAARDDATAQAEIALKQAQAMKTQAEAQQVQMENETAGKARADALFADAMAGMQAEMQTALPVGVM